MKSISDLLKSKILSELVEPCYYKDIDEMIKERKTWRAYGNKFETLSKIMIGSSSIISFATGIYDYKILAFVSGITSVLSLTFIQFSTYAFKESKERTIELDKILTSLDIENVPELSDEPEESSK